MAFLLLAPVDHHHIDDKQLRAAAGHSPIAWFVPGHPELGGAVALSPLTMTGRLARGNQLDCFIIGRIRLDRRAELLEKLFGPSSVGSSLTDADLCLHAFSRWGGGLTEHLQGEFAFALMDNLTRDLLCVRDHFGTRSVAWHQNGNALWVGGSMRDLVLNPNFQLGEFNRAWVTDFLISGVSSDPSASVYSSVHRLPAAHILSLGQTGISVNRYWALEFDQPLLLKGASAYLDEFHACLNASMHDRLPAEAVGIFLSGGLDSSTLAAKAVELTCPGYRVFANTWLASADDPEARESGRVSQHLGLKHATVEAIPIRFDPEWRRHPATAPEPSVSMLGGSSLVQEAARMRANAQTWLYGEGPDNALTFEWKTYLTWLVRRRRWAELGHATLGYLRSKSLRDWALTLQEPARRHESRASHSGHAWVRRAIGNLEKTNTSNEWRPDAHGNLTSSLWPALFEELDADFSSAAIDWRHPYMDMRVIEFLLRTPPIPWARHKLLIREAMKDSLPVETLSRRKAPLRYNPIVGLLRESLTDARLTGGAIEQHVDIRKMPDPMASDADSQSLIRVAILNHWLEAHGK